MIYSHQLVSLIESPREYRRIKSASVELEVPLQSASPVVEETCHAVPFMESPRELRRVKSASVVLVTEEYLQGLASKYSIPINTFLILFYL
ncbi:MAG: hypothetical protein ACD_7C00160G0002 [uncultured bacterium]|nr:MAG: hypothetical protein ACD_7C00160G0002 [uncultured bacterium]